MNRLTTYFKRVFYNCCFKQPDEYIQVRCTANDEILSIIQHQFKYTYPNSFTRYCLVFSLYVHENKELTVDEAHTFSLEIMNFINKQVETQEHLHKYKHNISNLVDIVLLECFQFENMKQALSYNSNILMGEGVPITGNE